jgi:hypothetical protein
MDASHHSSILLSFALSRCARARRGHGNRGNPRLHAGTEYAYAFSAYRGRLPSVSSRQ